LIEKRFEEIKFNKELCFFFSS